MSLSVCGPGAEIELVDPTMTVFENGVGPAAVNRPVVRPDGWVSKVSSTVCGCSSTLVLAEAPPESVAVNRSSRNDGYSWSGAVKKPEGTPANRWIWWVWQFDGQWCTSSVHVSRAAERSPSSASVAPPENA